MLSCLSEPLNLFPECTYYVVSVSGSREFADTAAGKDVVRCCLFLVCRYARSGFALDGSSAGAELGAPTRLLESAAV